MSDKVFLGQGQVDAGDLIPAERAMQEVLNELSYQKKRWGPLHDQKHTSREWALIVNDYSGRLAACALSSQDSDEVRKRLAQVASICLSALESLT